MQYSTNFGHLTATPRATPGIFRVALLGDFSGRASAGALARGKDLAARKTFTVDVDSLDTIIARLNIRITIPLGDEGTIEIPIACMDDFHPDQLVEAVPVFEELQTLRRALQSKAGFDRAAKQVLAWSGAEKLAPPPSRRAKGSAIPTQRMSDFARLTGRAPATEAAADTVIARLIGPYIVPATDTRQDALLARVDAAQSDLLRRILHNPDFQATEALWRGVDMLARGLETGASLQIVLYDISAQELAADLSATDELQDTALYNLLIEQPASDDGAGPLSVIAGLYGWELAPPHADMLGRIAQLAAAAGAPFLSAMAPDPLREPEHEWHPLIRSAWAALRASPAAAYLALATPRFLLRMPYGKRTDPIDAFPFEEFTRQAGLSSMVWGNPALLTALLLGQTWTKSGASMKPGTLNVVGNLPVYVYHDADGDQVALPCTERLFTERTATQIASTGVTPVLALRGRPELRVAGFSALNSKPLAGRWNPVELPAAPAPAPVATTPAAPSIPPPAVTEPKAEPEPPAMLTEPPAAAPPEIPPEEDLDALLASLSAEPPPAEPDATEDDLDALLASLK